MYSRTWLPASLWRNEPALRVLQMGQEPVGTLAHQRQQADPDVLSHEISDVGCLGVQERDMQLQYGDCGGNPRQAWG